MRRLKRLRAADHPLNASGSTSPFSRNHDGNGLEEDQQVEKQRTVLDVIKIELQFLDRILESRPVLVSDLSPSRDAGLHAVPYRIVGNLACQSLDKERTLRSRADQAHFPLEDV